VRISVSTRHGQLAPETQEKIGHKVEKLQRFHDRISSADVTVDLKEAKEPKVEVCVAVDGAASFVSQTHGSNLLGAVEAAVQKMGEQLKRHKRKIIDHHRDSARRNVQVEEPENDESEVE
jgi:putative sigma-54 modulation protein